MALSVEEFEKRLNGRVQEQVVPDSSAYDAVDRLNFTFNSMEEDLLLGQKKSPVVIHDNAENLSSDGSLKAALDQQVSSDVNKTVDAVDSQMASSLAMYPYGDSQYKQQRIDEMKLLNEIKSSEGAIKTSIGSGIFSSAFGSDLLEEKDRLTTEKRQRWIAEEGNRQSKLLQQGFDIGQIEDMTKGLEVPMYGPEDVVVDLFTFGFGSAGRNLFLKAAKATTEEARKTAINGLLKGTSKELTYGAIAGGFMSAADYVEAGAFSTTLSGILGPLVTATLATGTRKSISMFMTGLRDGNPSKYLDMMNIAKKHGNDKFSKMMLEIHDDIDNGRISLTGEKLVETSPYTRTEPTSKSEVERLTNIVGSSLSEEGSKLKTDAQEALGVNEYTKHLTLDSGQYGDMVTKDLILPVEGHTDLSKYIHNSTTIGKLIGKHEFIDSEYGDKATDLIFNRLYRDDTFISGDLVNESFRLFADPTRKVKTGMRGHLGTATGKLQDAAGLLVEVPTHAIRQTEAFIKTSKDVIKHVRSNLSNKELSQLETILEDSTVLERKLKMTPEGLIDPKSGKVITSNEKIIDSWATVRSFLNQLHFQYNRAINRDLKATGHIMIDGGIVGKKVKSGNIKYGTTLSDGAVVTRELKDSADFYNIKAKDGTEGLIAIPKNSVGERVRELNENLMTMPFKDKDYLPIILDKNLNKFFVTEFNPKTGKSRTIASGADKTQARELATKLKQGNPSSFYVAHERGTRGDFGDIDMGIEGNLLNFLRSQRGEDLDRIRKVLDGSGEFDAGTVEFMIKLGQKYNFAGSKMSHFKKRGKERVKSIESVMKKLDTLSEADAAMIKKAVKEADIAELTPALDAVASYADKISRKINTYELNKKIERAYTEKYSDVINGTYWNSKVRTEADGLPRELRGKAEEAKTVQKQLETIFNVPSQVVRDIEEVRAARLAELDDKNTIVSKYIQAPLVKTFDTRLLTIGRASKKLGAFAAFWGNGSQFIVQQTGMLFSLGKHMMTDLDVAATALRDTHEVLMYGKFAQALGAKLDPNTELKVRLIDKSGFIAGQGGDFIDDVKMIGKERTRLGGVYKLIKDIGYVPLRAGETIARTASWFAEYNAIVKKIENGTHPTLTMRDMNTDKMLTEVNILAERVANFSKVNRGTLTKDGLTAAVTQFLQFPQIAAEIMYGKAGKLRPIERVGVQAAWWGFAGIESVPFLWDIVDRYEMLTDQKGYVKDVVKDGVQNAIEWFGEMVNAPDQLISVMQKIADGGVVPKEFADIATRISMGSMLPRGLETMQAKDLAGPGLSAFYNILEGTVKTLSDLQRLSDEGGLKDPEAIAHSIGVNYNRVAVLRNLATSVGIEGDYLDKYGEQLLSDMSTWQKIQIAFGITPTELVERREERFTIRQKNAQDRENTNNMRLSIERLPAEHRNGLAWKYAESLMEDGRFVEANRFMSDISRSVMYSDADAELRDMMIKMNRLKQFGQLEE